MNPGEKYNYIINLIEECVDSDQFNDSSEIVKLIADKTLMTNRELNVIFKFFKEKSILEYVKERQMNRAYNLIISYDDFDCTKAIEITGYSEQAAFIKAFKNVFSVTPYDAFCAYKNEGIDINKSFIDWDNLNSDRQIERINTEQVQLARIYGLNKSNFDLMKQIEFYRKIYDFDDYQADCAYKLIRKGCVDFIQVFEVLSEYKKYIVDYDFVMEYDMDFLDWALDIMKTMHYVTFEDLLDFKYFTEHNNIDITEMNDYNVRSYLKNQDKFMEEWYEKQDIIDACNELKDKGMDISVDEFYEIIKNEKITVLEARIKIENELDEERHEKNYVRDYLNEKFLESCIEYKIDLYFEQKDNKKL